MCGYNAYNADVCTGDSGGPMTIKPFNKKVYQIGVASYGTKECGLKE